ncbi:MAG: S8 family serine peptidase [Candidatus Sericytochromatia bacterium]|nr:S8 family serine peptidase [Candidatus Tanganyikabacteria bacterium]
MRARRFWFLCPLAISLAACGKPASLAPQPAPLLNALQAAEADLPRIAPPPEEGQAFPGEAIVRFKDGEEAPAAIPGGERLRPVEGVPGAWVYRLTGGRYTTAATAGWEADPRIAYAEPLYVYRTQEYPAGEDKTLYGLNRIKAPAAWAKATGKSGVLVAVVDTGVDYNHPDLEGAVVKGPDVVNRDSDPLDDHGHGTHVAGTIGAVANGSGIVGVAYGVKILGVKVLAKSGFGSQAGIAEGINSAVKNGAQVINMSLGGPDSRAMRDAIVSATKKGVLCVAAAGNDGDKDPDYPGAQPEALGVGATDSADKRSYFSNYGTTVDIAAPGSNIYSLGLGKAYKTMSGTSMATPHVAGAAALLLSFKPDLTVAQLRKILEETGDAASGFTETPQVRRLNLEKALAAAEKLGAAPAPTPGPTAPPTPADPPPAADPPAPPAITGIKTSVTSNSATIRWSTDLPAIGSVDYGETTDYGKVAAKAGSYAKTHEVVLTGLKWRKIYHFRINATTEAGGKASSSDGTVVPRYFGILTLD